jgi:hypothetical protein
MRGPTRPMNEPATQINACAHSRAVTPRWRECGDVLVTTPAGDGQVRQAEAAQQHAPEGRDSKDARWGKHCRYDGVPPAPGAYQKTAKRPATTVTNADLHITKKAGPPL